MLIAGSGNGESAAELLRFFSALNRDGTLVLRRGATSLYSLIEAGKVKLQREANEFGGLAETVDSFTWLEHERNQLPWLNASSTESGIGALRALPCYGTAQRVFNAATDLPTLLALLEEHAFFGALILADGSESGIAILTDGKVRAAAYERDGYIWQRVDALRALQRHSLQAELPPLKLLPLDETTALSLAGLALDARAGGNALTDYSGITSSDSGYVYFAEGKPYLQVRGDVLVAGVRYAQPKAENLPELQLPRGAPGWEDKRFVLTLRGRDALIPMTALAMDFDAKFGPQGRQLLELLQQGLSAEEVSAKLQVDLSTIQSGLEALVNDGMIRARK